MLSLSKRNTCLNCPLFDLILAAVEVLGYVNAEGGLLDRTIGLFFDTFEMLSGVTGFFN